MLDRFVAKGRTVLCLWNQCFASLSEFFSGGLILMQVYFAFRVKRTGERVAADRKAIEREGCG